eukprot:CAMPEP_0176111024 /NCGR_PEP_ID=MMETSP0120_2-20121206/55750_1 /TAXON_ID=160619 /ORGANISM="Kryptoperidinium foliaceum, Strain CCMP 1326" /LENGTH=61 /DNA_ID=CAMNT_0017445233 /DNA_START=667 /DNA_END=849 /DNA_ORIENTATION=+
MKLLAVVSSRILNLENVVMTRTTRSARVSRNSRKMRMDCMLPEASPKSNGNKYKSMLHTIT